MTKLVLDPMLSGASVAVINENFQKISDELQNKVLYRNNTSGEANSLSTDLDTNGKRVYNLPPPALASEAARLQDVQNAISGVASANLIAFTPYGTIAASNVQGAIQEVVDDLSSQAGASLVSILPLGTGAKLTTLQDWSENIVYAMDFIPVSERDAIRNHSSIYNCTDDLYAACQHIVSLGGGRLVVSGGTYNVGKQTFAAGSGKGYSYLASPIIKINGCSKPVIVEMQGAKLKLVSGLKFGSFDPITGLANAPALPNTNLNYQAGVGSFLSFSNNTGGVSVFGSCELDGNSGAISLGGQWGDVGYQCEGIGVFAYTNSSFYAENIYTHHHGLDGVEVGYLGAVDGGALTPINLVNIRSTYNCRQGISLIGGIGISATNCQFSNTGRGAFYSAPGAGVDIEAEGSMNRKVLFTNCDIGGNTGYGVVADSGDSKDIVFDNCRIYGTIQNALWCRKPKMRFVDCTISGGINNAYLSPNDEDRNQFIRCKITDGEIFEGVQAVGSQVAIVDFSSQNAVFEDCDFLAISASRTLPSTGSNNVYRGCRLTQSLNAATASPHGIYEGVNKITMKAGTADLSSTLIKGSIECTGTTAGIIRDLVTGAVAGLTSPNYATTYFMASNSVVNRNFQVFYNYASPTTGGHYRGDKCFNSNCTVGSPKGWVCTVDSPTGITGAITSGTNTLTLSAASTFANGQGIDITGAGSGGSVLHTTITSGGGTVNLVLATNALTTVSTAPTTHTGTWVSEGNL